MAVFSSVKMSHQRVRMKLCTISQVVLSLICAHALTLIAPISYLPKRSFMKRLCCQSVSKKCAKAFFLFSKDKAKDSSAFFVRTRRRRLRRDRKTNQTPAKLYFHNTEEKKQFHLLTTNCFFELIFPFVMAALR